MKQLRWILAKQYPTTFLGKNNRRPVTRGQPRPPGLTQPMCERMTNIRTPLWGGCFESGMLIQGTEKEEGPPVVFTEVRGFMQEHGNLSLIHI